MALKPVIDTLDGVSPAVREHYTAKDGKYHLTLEGEHPDTARVKEFRDSAITAAKERDALKAKFEGIDPATVAADKAKLADYEKAKPNERIAELEAKLAAANASANSSILKDAVTGAFVRAGGRLDAADFVLQKAGDRLAVENGVVVGKGFDPSRPGVRLDVDGFIALMVREHGFAFKPSGGGGANPSPGGGGPSRANELVDPTPQQLGEHAAAIKAGRVKVRYSNS